MTLQKTTRTLIALCTSAMALGCTTEERPTTTGSSPSESIISEPDSKSAIRYSASLKSVFKSTLSSENVMAGRAFLESEGYSYVDTNSMVLLLHHGERGSRTATPTAVLPDRNRVPDPDDFVQIDTILWLAFENPTHDLGNHTAIISSRDADITLLVELDVSTDLPTLIREGKIVDGQFTPGDVGTQGWLACMGAGIVGSAIACGFTNCGWAACTGAGSAGTLAACTFSWAFGS